MTFRTGLIVIAAVIVLALAAASHAPFTPASEPRLSVAMGSSGRADADAIDFEALRGEADAALKALVEKASTSS